MIKLVLGPVAGGEHWDISSMRAGVLLVCFTSVNAPRAQKRASYKASAERFLQSVNADVFGRQSYSNNQRAGKK